MNLPLAVLFSAVAFGATAETVAVRSGEHDGFSRLVLPLAAPAPWHFGRTLDGYALQVDRPGVEFDLSRVFARIPRLRLADLAGVAGESTLSLQLNCACHAEAFAFRPDILVIDIRPGPPPKGSPFEQTLKGTPTPAAAPAGLAPRPDPRARADMPVYDWRANAPAIPPEPAIPPPAAPPAPPPPADPRLDALQDHLIREIGRAAAQGLLTPDPAALAHDPPAVEAPAPAPAAAPAQPPPAPPPETARMTAQTALDRAVGADQAAAYTPAGGACVPDARVDVRSWGDARAPSDQIAERRMALVGEFDHASPEAVAELMHLYLYLGFGAEARALPGAMRVTVADADLLTALADVMDRGAASDPGPLRGQAGCDGAVALWAVLADPSLPSGSAVNTAAVLRTFSALPAPLRRLLGPGLATRLLTRNETEAARAVRDAVSRASGAPDPAVDLVGARLDLAQGRPEDAARIIRKVADGDSPATPDALVLLAETQADSGTPLDPATVDSIAALQREFRGTVTGRNLARAHLLAQGLSDDFDAAFDELAALRATPGAGNTGAAALWQLLADHGSDEMVLRHALDPAAAPDAARRIRTVLARRLIALGFPEAGEAWLLPLSSPTDAERLLMAEADLARGAPEAVGGQLGGVEGKAAERLRAAAAAALGDHPAAIAAYARAGAPELAATEAWRAGDWTGVKELGAPLQQAAAATVLETPAETAATPAPGPLAAGRALVDRSQHTRQMVEQVLAATAVPPAAP